MVIRVNVEFLAKDAVKAVDRGDLIVIIDALRCSSTIVTALANGAKAIIPVRTLDEARRFHAENPNYILAGERGGLKPRGFELGNSPLEYTPEKVSGKIIILTTTSGTSALTYSRGAKWIFVGSFLNAKAVAEKSISIANAEDIGISIVQAGTKGRFSLEDFLCTGAIVNELSKSESEVELSDAAQASLLAFKDAEDDLLANIMKSNHSKKLIELGFTKDIEFSCRKNLFSIVPIYRKGIITKIE